MFIKQNDLRFHIDNGSRIGIGINNPSDYFASYNRVVMGRPNDSGSMTIVSAPTFGGYISFADGTSGNQAYRGLITYAHGQDEMIFSTGAVARLRIKNNGNVGIATTNAQDLLHIGGGTNTNLRFTGNCLLLDSTVYVRCHYFHRFYIICAMQWNFHLSLIVLYGLDPTFYVLFALIVLTLK